MTATLRAVPDPDELPSVCDVAEGVIDLKDAIDLLRAKREMPLAYLWEMVGKEMLAKGQRTKTIDGVRYHVDEPREREYCLCCASLLYQCRLGPKDRTGVFTRLDALPSFYLTRVKEKD